MTVSSSITKAIYSGNGVTAAFPITFSYTDASEVAVYFTNASGAISKVSSNVTIDTVNNQVLYPAVGTPIASGTKLTVIRETATVQEVDLSNQGYFTPTVMEQALDKLTRMSQELVEKINRTIRYSVDENPSAADTETFLSSIEAAKAEAQSFSQAAAASASNAEDAETGAANSASAASLSAASAATSASTALTKANEAGDSETNAAASAAAAEAAETGATTKAGEAAASQVAAATSETNAANSANTAATQATTATNAAIAAAAAADSVLWNDVVFITVADSPFAITDAMKGKLFSVDASGGAVSLTLPQISVLDLSNPWVIGVKKTDSSTNQITINRGGADSIDGSVTKIIELQNAGATLIPDVDPNPDMWTSCDFGASSGGGLGAAQGTRQAALSISAATQITPSTGKAIQAIFVKGNGGPVTVTNVAPIATANMSVGQIVTLAGTDDVNLVTFQSGNKLVLNGDATLKKDSILKIEYLGTDGTNAAWVESGRNF